MLSNVRFSPLAVSLALSGAAITPAFGHSETGSGIGQKGDTSDVSRTVTVEMLDNSYEPATLDVEAGETVRFVVTNAGELVHEFNIGNSALHQAHREEMMTMVENGVLLAASVDHGMMSKSGMSHDDPNAVLLEPGGQGEVVWTFPQSGTLQFACNVPGHYEAGMVGDIRIGKGSAQ
jgi:uncharacterized cupredoxin-like copper-binding protein